MGGGGGGGGGVLNQLHILLSRLATIIDLL